MALDMAQNFCSGTVTATTGTTVTYSNTGAVNFPTTLTAPYDITIWNSTLYSVPQLDPNVSIFRVTSATSTIFTGSWVSPSDEYASGTTLSLISGDTYSCTLFITAKMVQDLNTLLFGNLTSSNLSSTAGITGSQLSSPLNLSQNVTLGGTTTNNGTISGGAVNPATITASGLITADGGITSTGVIVASGGLNVPSGQTAAVSGTLDVTGTATVPAATLPTQPVNLSQFAVRPHYQAFLTASFVPANMTSYTIASVAITMPLSSKTGAFRILARMSINVSTGATNVAQSFQIGLSDGTNIKNGTQWEAVVAGAPTSLAFAETILSTATYPPGSSQTISFVVEVGGGTVNAFSINNESFIDFFVEEA